MQPLTALLPVLSGCVLCTLFSALAADPLPVGPTPKETTSDSSTVPTLLATRSTEDFAIDGKLDDSIWKEAKALPMERETKTAEVRPDISTPVRAAWTDSFLYLAYDCPFTELTTFEPPNNDKERIGLWDRDVVEAFIAPDPNKITHYSEYEVAPTGEKLDLLLQLRKSDFEWSSHFEAAVRIDEVKKRWTVEMKIPMNAFVKTAPKAGDRWRINLYRVDRAHGAFLALNPTLNASYHTPARFAHLEFMK